MEEEVSNNRKKEVIEARKKQLHDHVLKCTQMFNTYFAVDYVNNKEYQKQLVDDYGQQKCFVYGDGKALQIVCAAIVEEKVRVRKIKGHSNCCIIHYIATHSGHEFNGYASDMLRMLWSHHVFQNRTVYFVTQLHNFDVLEPVDFNITDDLNDNYDSTIGEPNFLYNYTNASAYYY